MARFRVAVNGIRGFVEEAVDEDDAIRQEIKVLEQAVEDLRQKTSKVFVWKIPDTKPSVGFGD